MERINNLKPILSKNKILILILFLSFGASIAYSFYFKIKPVVDARAYDVIAMNIALGNGFRENLAVDIKYDYAIARVGPLYQYFLAGTYKILSHHYEYVWLIQAVLHAASAGLVYLICLLVFAPFEQKKRAALWSAAIFGFYPDLIEISAMLMTETLYLFLFCLLLFLFYYYFQQNNIRSVLFLGLVSGLSVLARPPILFLIPITVFYFWQKKKINWAVIFCAALVAVFLPWTMRNYDIYRKIMPFGVAGAYNFWIGNYHGANGEQEQPAAALEFIDAGERPIVELQDKSMKELKYFLTNYPGEFVKLTFLRINKYFSIIRPMGFWFYQTGLSQFLFLFSSASASVILFIFGLGGFIRSVKLKEALPLYLAAFTAVTPLIIFVTVVETRYRFQIYPLLAVFAGYFIVYLTENKKWRADKVLLFAVAAVFLNGAIDLILSLDRLKERLGWFF